MPYCSNCGSETAPTDEFCPYCGSVITPQNDYSSQLPSFQASGKRIEISQNGDYTTRSVSSTFASPAPLDLASDTSSEFLIGDRKNPLLAFFLTIIIPGFTYFYLGEHQKGLLLTIIVYLGYMIIIGFLVHIILIITSYGSILHYNEVHGY